MRYIFYIAFFLIFYIFLGYPIIISVLSYIFPKRITRQSYLPSVSVLLSVYNEEERIERRIENLLNLDYPLEKIDFLIGSDGSVDNTNAILRNFKNKRVRTFIFPNRKGKPSVLNALAKEARGDILVFADCRQEWERNSLKELVKNFVNKKVGVVSGQIDEGENSFYRTYENFVRAQEARFDSIPGTCGPFYGLKTELFKNLPDDTILDDFILPMNVVRQGFRSVLEPLAIAHDICFALEHEKIRKARTLAGNFQAFSRYPWLLNPFNNRIWFQTISHKFLRLLLPPCLILLIISSAVLLKEGSFFLAFFILQVIFYSCAFVGKIIESRKITKPINPITKFLKFAAAFLELNWATILGFSSFLTGQAKVTWPKYKKK